MIKETFLFKLIKCVFLISKKEVYRTTFLIDLLKYGFLPVMVLIAFITKNEVIGWITAVLLIGLLTTLAALIAYLLSQRLIERISTIKSWSYKWDDKYSAYSIQAKKSLLGMTWSINEYLSTTEEEAKTLVDRKSGTQ